MPLKKKSKNRLAQVLVKLSLAPSIKKAQALILAKKVSVNNETITKAHFLVSDEAQIHLLSPSPYVSRGGVKLAGALEAFAGLAGWLQGKIAVDLGASTGGFTDCLLKNDCSLVYALDVGYGQLHPKLAGDKRVKVMDRLNARLLSKENFLDLDQPDFFTADLSFISLRKILPVINKVFNCIPGLVLVKPQFELSREKNTKGVVTVWEDRLQAIRLVCRKALAEGWNISGISSSPILGPKGNQEFWIFLLDPNNKSGLKDLTEFKNQIVKFENFLRELVPLGRNTF